MLHRRGQLLLRRTEIPLQPVLLHRLITGVDKRRQPNTLQQLGHDLLTRTPRPIQRPDLNVFRIALNQLRHHRQRHDNVQHLPRRRQAHLPPRVLLQTLIHRLQAAVIHARQRVNEIHQPPLVRAHDQPVAPVLAKRHRRLVDRLRLCNMLGRDFLQLAFERATQNHPQVIRRIGFLSQVLDLLQHPQPVVARTRGRPRLVDTRMARLPVHLGQPQEQRRINVVDARVPQLRARHPAHGLKRVDVVALVVVDERSCHASHATKPCQPRAMASPSKAPQSVDNHNDKTSYPQAARRDPGTPPRNPVLCRAHADRPPKLTHSQTPRQRTRQRQLIHKLQVPAQRHTRR